MREAVDEGDRTGRVRKDRVPLLEEQIRGDDDRALFVAATDNLKEQVGGVGLGSPSCSSRTATTRNARNRVLASIARSAAQPGTKLALVVMMPRTLDGHDVPLLQG